jgi:2-oxoglutarate ferredoxin oxidoreductase subunit alpha
MGVPVSPRNIFPSNIQGLPTWYEVRVCEAGWLGRRGGIDMMVAMNPQTWAQDVAEVEPGGYLFYDSTRPLPASAFRERHQRHRHAGHRDLQRHLRRPAPAHAVQEHHGAGRAVVLMDIEPEVIEKLFGEQYKGKERLLESNVRALQSRPQLRQGPPAAASACAC